MTETEYVYDIAQDQQEVLELESWINSSTYWNTPMVVRIVVHLRIAELKYRMKHESN